MGEVLDFLLIAGGFVVLTLGADFLVRGASLLAVAAGIPSLVIGLTVVAVGTASPEMAVSVKAALDGNGGICVGNVVGSDIFNLFVILGVSAVIAPLAVPHRIIHFDAPIMLGSFILAWLLAFDGSIGHVDGLILLAGIITYTLLLIWKSKRNGDGREKTTEIPRTRPNLIRAITIPVLLTLIGLVLLVFGARWLVEGASHAALAMGVSPLVIGLTIIAIGTSLPELATSVLATIRGEREIAIGNVVGSSIYNALAVLGLGGLVGKHGVAVSTTAFRVDMPIMIAAAALCILVFRSGGVISRWNGILFLLYYVAYMAYLTLAATGSPFGVPFARGMLWFVIPATLIPVAFAGIRTVRAVNPVN